MTRVRLAALILLAPVPEVLAHGLDPALLSLHATVPGVYDVTWRTAAARLPGTDVQPILPSRCRQIGGSVSEIGQDDVTLRWTVDCGAAGLAGETLAIRDLDAARINALVRIEEAGRPALQEVMHARRSSLVVPAQPSRLGVVRAYVELGIEHILMGPDHLLFVLGLLLLLSSPRMLVKVVTAFTVGHSITLSAAALGLATLPSRPVEVAIALSILALAVELARDARTGGPMRRWPWMVALGFGLLHGFGFAGALAETGLPAGDVPLALFAFNLGIEIGQLAFVVAVLVTGTLVHRRRPETIGVLRRPAVYVLGILAAFWCFERAAPWLG
jgi:hydrogenase/urease accessory protein HupE